MDRKKKELGEPGKATAEVISPSTSPDSTNSLAKSDELFRQGEDLYAVGGYEEAIHVWTRILFLERGDSRAKTAIEQAKRAIAERQRELDVEIATAARALERGELGTAEDCVRRVLSVDPRHREGHGLSERIAARTRRASGGTAPPRPTPTEPSPPAKRGLLLRVSHGTSSSLSDGQGASALKMAGFVLAVVLVFASGALYLHLNWESIVSDRAFLGVSSGGGGPSPVDASAPTASELHYYNGARLYSKGRYRQALAELSQVERDDAVFERARSLILRIEERLLRGGELSDPADAPAAIER